MLNNKEIQKLSNLFSGASQESNKQKYKLIQVIIRVQIKHLISA